MLQEIRKQYEMGTLSEQTIMKDPFEQFQLWLTHAIDTDQPEATAMILSTVDEKNYPQSRVVLLKELSLEGFTFFTNYKSAKSLQLNKHNQVSLLFFWPGLERQVRIVGNVSQTDELTSDRYFESRPYESRLGAWASPQSQIINSAEYLQEQFEAYKDKFKESIPRPPHWGGYLVQPISIEFWQGRPYRLHDRLVFERTENNWELKRLAP